MYYTHMHWHAYIQGISAFVFFLIVLWVLCVQLLFSCMAQLLSVLILNKARLS